MFRKYVESNGVVEMMCKAMIELMNSPVKPENPLDFIRDNLGATLKEKMQIDHLQQECEAYRKEVDDLKRQLEEVKQQQQQQEQEQPPAVEPLTNGVVGELLATTNAADDCLTNGTTLPADEVAIEPIAAQLETGDAVTTTTVELVAAVVPIVPVAVAAETVATAAEPEKANAEVTAPVVADADAALKDTVVPAAAAASVAAVVESPAVVASATVEPPVAVVATTIVAEGAGDNAAAVVDAPAEPKTTVAAAANAAEIAVTEPTTTTN